MTEPLSVAVQAAMRAPIEENDRVLVVGCGIIGLLTIQVLRATGSQSIVAADLSEKRLLAARASGADVAVPPTMIEAQGEMDAAFEASDSAG